MSDNASLAPKPFIFVLMPFDTKFQDIYKFGIKGAADDVGAYAERLDDQMFAEGMLDRIFNQISKADVIVADMTGRNPNVFYEVGYAHALGKIVLLLTQDKDDIPFDLKHRQHTVYGGKIELLRTELAAKLQWAIAESRRARTPEKIERISLLVEEIDILEGQSDVPLLSGSVQQSDFLLRLQLRNDAPEALLGITHVYLFTAPDSNLIPFQYRSTAFDTTYTTGFYGAGGTFGTPIQTPEPLDAMTASPLDAEGGLTLQYRLNLAFPALPPGAVEVGSLFLMLKAATMSCDDVIRLRLHTASQYHDYVFRLQITKTPPAKDKVVPKARSEKDRAQAQKDSKMVGTALDNDAARKQKGSDEPDTKQNSA